MNQNKIGEIIEKKRKEKHLTQKELAEALGVSNTAISKWENGNNLPDISMLEPLCKILDLDLLELITTQNSMHEDCSKKFAKVRKARLYRTISLSLFFISVICLTNIFTYHRIMSKRKEDLSKEVEVYKINSNDLNFRVDGYVLFNETENIIFLEKVVYQAEENLDIDFKKLTTATYFMRVDKQTIIKQKIDLTNKKIEKLNDILTLIKTTSYTTETNLKSAKGKFHKMTFAIELTNEKDEKINIEANLNLKRIFT